MSVRGTVTLECDTNGCHAEDVIDAADADSPDGLRSGVQFEFYQDIHGHVLVPAVPQDQAECAATVRYRRIVLPKATAWEDTGRQARKRQ